MIPSKNCANMKIIPSHAPLLPPLDYPRRPLPSTERCKNSHSLPQLTADFPNSSGKEMRELSRPEIMCTERPSTPNEKRYNVNFGKKKTEAKPRPRSSCIYENPYVKDEYCGRNSLYKVDKNFVPPNIRVNEFPIPEYSQMYIQDNF